MKKLIPDIGPSRIWEAVFSLQEGKNVDLNEFSPEEKKEIEESLEIIKAIESSQEDMPVPSKTSFNEMLLNLPEKNTFRQRGEWNHFFTRWRGDARQWMVIPVLGILAIAIASWNFDNRTEIKVATAEILSAEIEDDFQNIYQEMKEIELIKKDLDLVYLEKEQQPFYF